MRYTHSQLAYWQIISNNNEYTELLCSFISVYTTINGYYEKQIYSFCHVADLNWYFGTITC